MRSGLRRRALGGGTGREGGGRAAVLVCRVRAAGGGGEGRGGGAEEESLGEVASGLEHPVEWAGGGRGAAGLEAERELGEGPVAWADGEFVGAEEGLLVGRGGGPVERPADVRAAQTVDEDLLAVDRHMSRPGTAVGRGWGPEQALGIAGVDGRAGGGRGWALVGQLGERAGQVSGGCPIVL